MQMEFQTKELEENVQQGEKSLIENKKEIEILTKKIAKAQTELDAEIEPKFQEAKDAVSRITTEREETQNKIDGLYEKQGRGQQYTSKEDRDQDLRSQIKELEHVKMEKEGFLNEQQDTLANLRRSISSGTDDLNNKMNELNKKDKVLEKLNQDYQDKRKQRHDMAEERKVRWGLLSDLSTRVADARDSVNNADHAFRRTIPRNTAIGLKNLSRIVAEEKLVVGEQYFGPIMNNFELVDPKYQTAIEAGAQNQVFHVIVDTDATAARLIERLQRDNLGRVTFLPLNTLQFHNSRNPDTRDVRPLISCLKYNQRIHKAMHHVFGRKILAKDAEVAHTWATRLNMDAVTLDGDICERKGCMVGGYRDESKRYV
jgi:structural maintenance of chromosome 3 (chondroitin sulfate proteoglycan 6)